MGEYGITREPTEDSSFDGSLSVSIPDPEEESVLMEEFRRQREESARRHRCCICGTLYTQDEGRLLWHINPWFFYALYVHDMHQLSLGQDYLPGTPVSEVLRNAGVLFTDEQGRILGLSGTTGLQSTPISVQEPWEVLRTKKFATLDVSRLRKTADSMEMIFFSFTLQIE